MTRKIFMTALVALACFAFAAKAPAGPGDCQPIGPLPYVAVYGPASIGTKTTQCTIWLYSYNMPCGVACSLTANSHAVTILEYSETQCSDGTWVGEYLIDMTKLPKPWGPRITWLDTGTDQCTGLQYTGSATTTVVG
jgi:hypothetical protein